MAGIEDVLIDAAQDSADRGKAYSTGLLDKAISRKKATEEKKAQVLDRITATTDYAALQGCDLIVEAVFEDPSVKAEVTKKAEAVIPQDAIFATNTSTLPISDLAGASARPRTVHRHPLLQPGRQDAAGRDHQGRENRSRGGRQGAGFRAPDPQDPHRRERRTVLLCQPLHHPYINEGIRMVARGREPHAGGKRRQYDGHAPGSAAAGRRDLDRLGRQDRQGDQGRDGRRLSRRRGRRRAVLDGRPGADGPQGRRGFYAYEDGKRQGLWEVWTRSTRAAPISPTCTRSSTA